MKDFDGAPTLADAFNLGRMQAVDLAPALSLALLQHAPGQVERPPEDRLEILFARDLAPDVVASRRPSASRIVRPR